MIIHDINNGVLYHCFLSLNFHALSDNLCCSRTDLVQVEVKPVQTCMCVVVKIFESVIL